MSNTELQKTVGGEVFTPDEINIMKEQMRNQGIKVEHDFMKAISNFQGGFGVDDLVKVYMDQLTAVTTNKFGEDEPDNKARLAAANQLLKLMTGNNGTANKTIVQVNNQTNVWSNPIPDGQLKY